MAITREQELWAKDVFELWDRSPSWAARSRQSPDALPPSLVEVLDPQGAGVRSRAPRAMELRLREGSRITLRFKETEDERRALIQGTLALEWNGEPCIEFDLEAGLSGADSLRIVRLNHAYDGPWADRIHALLAEGQRQDAASREGRDAWRKMREEAALDYLPKKKI